MAYPIFDETMVDLTWKELEMKAKEHLPVLLPISIIEEHGPHMDLAPDVYLVHEMAKNIKKIIKKDGIDSLISPPMYWGVSKCTESFPGTFTVRPETMIEIIYDLVISLHSWGFNKIFILNEHGDLLHIQTIIKAIKKIKKKLDINIYYLFEEESLSYWGADGTEDYLLLYKSELDNSFPFSEFADIHAGGEETSSMLNSFPNSVSKEMLSKLNDSKIGYDKLEKWKGVKAREMTPLGYCGNPSNFNTEAVKEIDDFLLNSISSSIVNKLKCL